MAAQGPSNSRPNYEWLVPAMVQLELAEWLTLEAGEDKADQVIGFTATCVVADLDTTIALSAAELGARQKLAAADAIIYATARAHDAELLPVTGTSRAFRPCVTFRNQPDGTSTSPFPSAIGNRNTRFIVAAANRR